MEEWEKVYKEAVKHIPKLKSQEYKERTKEAVIESKKTLKPSNPFKKLKGEYKVEIMDKYSINKIGKVQNTIIDIILSKYPDRPIFMKPTEKNKFFYFDDDGIERSTKISRFIKSDPELFKLIQKQTTLYPSVKDAGIQTGRIKITNDKVDILRKSSSRPWAGYSCESIGAGYDKGSFSDIANNNAIAYLYLGDNKEPDARYMLRWCVDDTGKDNVGLETVMYPPGKGYDKSVYQQISKIILDKGYGNYKSCKTPYYYNGYSDHGGGSGHISYKKVGIDNLQRYASDPNISRNQAISFLNAPIETVRTLAENKGICREDMEDVVKKIIIHESDDTVLEHLFDNCKPVLDKETCMRYMGSSNPNVRSYVARQMMGS